MVNIPLWQQILSPEGRKIFKLKTGPSIPFLVGVYFMHHLLEENELTSDSCIRRVFEEILNTKGDMTVNVVHCQTIDAKVITIKPSNNNTSLTDLSIDRWVKLLWEEYGKYIQNRRFSIDKDDHSWREFIKEEKEIIEQLKIFVL